MNKQQLARDDPLIAQRIPRLNLKNYETKLQVKLLDTRLGKDIPLPQYATSRFGRFGLARLFRCPLTLNPGDTQLIRTGMAIYIEDANLAAMILPRSGLGHKHGIVLGNLVGDRLGLPR